MDHNAFYEYRVHKYRKYSETNVPPSDQWTSISDIGKEYDGKILTYAQYEQVEKRYLQLIRNVCLQMNIDKLQIISLENPFGICPYPNLFMLDTLDQILEVAKGCIREQYWCKLQTDQLFFHFGYDYYLYIGAPIDTAGMSDLVRGVDLILEERLSPYKEA